MNVEHHGDRRFRAAWLPGSMIAVVLAVLLGAMIGPAGPVWWRVPLALIDHLPLISIDSGVSEREWAIIWDIRMPRVVLAGLVGAMLSVGGASYQGVFRNPLVDPYLLGAAAGAGLGATLMIAIWRERRLAVGSRSRAGGGVRRVRPGRGGDHVSGRRLVRRHAHHIDARIGGGCDGVVADGDPDVRVTAQLRRRS